MICPQSSARQAGFTLAEMLVALFILSILAVAGGNLLLRATASGEQLRHREATVRQLDIAQALIRSDLESVIRRGVEPVDTYGGPITLAGGETNRVDGLLRLVRNGWMNPDGTASRSDLQAVNYSLSAEGELVRTAWLRPDATASTPVAERVLLRDVADVDLAFWKGDQMSAYWEGTPEPPANEMPDIVEIRIRFDDGRVLTIASGVGGGQ